MGDEFINVGKPDVANRIVIDDYEDFRRALESSDPAIKYRWEEKRQVEIMDEDEEMREFTEEVTKLGFLAQGALHTFAIPRQFPSIEEYLKAEQEGFQQFNYQEWKAIKELGFKDLKEFDKARGDYTLADMKRIRRLGYSTSEEFDSARGNYDLESWARIKKMGFENAEDFDQKRGDISADAWINIRRLGFKTPAEFREVESMGFVGVKTSKEVYYESKEYDDGSPFSWDRDEGITGKWLQDINFVEMDDFYAAKKGGFENRDEYLEAQEDGFDNAEDWREFTESKFENRDDFLGAKKLGIHDPLTKAVYDFLVGFEEGIPVAISKIEEATDVDADELAEICSHEKISELGTLIEAAGFFKREGKTKPRGIKVKPGAVPFEYAVVDGSNVAYANNDEEPHIGNIISVKEALEERGIKPIVMVSASLRYKIDEKEELEKRIKNGEFIQTPAGSDNDAIIIESALEKDALIVSNDQFKDWLEANPEEAQRISEHRVGVTFVDGDVHFDKKLSKLRSGRKKEATK